MQHLNQIASPADHKQLDKAKKIYRAFCHPLRQKMLDSLLASQKPVTVTELYVNLRIEQSVCSQHLAILRSVKLVKTQRDGKFIYYTVDVPTIKNLIVNSYSLIN